MASDSVAAASAEAVLLVCVAMVRAMTDVRFIGAVMAVVTAIAAVWAGLQRDGRKRGAARVGA